MRPALLTTAAVGLSLALSGQASAQNKGNGSGVRPAAAVPKAAPSNSNSMGSTRASQRAIEVVCGSNTPAADRAAICRPGPISRG